MSLAGIVFHHSFLVFKDRETAAAGFVAALDLAVSCLRRMNRQSAIIIHSHSYKQIRLIIKLAQPLRRFIRPAARRNKNKQKNQSRRSGLSSIGTIKDER
jgi:hypothetical protein